MLAFLIESSINEDNRFCATGLGQKAHEAGAQADILSPYSHQLAIRALPRASRLLTFESTSTWLMSRKKKSRLSTKVSSAYGKSTPT